MHRFSRTRSVVLVAALAAAAVGAPSLTAAAQASTSAKAGLIGGRVLLQSHGEFTAFDAVTDSIGYTFIGWIGSDANDPNGQREVHTCTLAPLGTACVGGVTTIDPLGNSSAEGLRVLSTGQGAELVWFHDTLPGSVNGPEGGEIAVATVGHNGVLSSATDVASAPSFGYLYDAEFGPGGALWTIAGGDLPSVLEVREGVTNPPVMLPTPYGVGFTELAFQGTTPVIAAQKYGAVITPIETTHGVGGGFSGWTAVKNTWPAAANIGLVGTKSGVRLTAAVGNSDYWPVIAKFNGTGFGKVALTGDKSACAPASHDLVTDASGRTADIANECGKLAVYNMPNTVNEASFKFSAGGTVSDGPPQISTSPRGYGIALWSIEAPSVANNLYFNRILLPGRAAAVSHFGVTVTAPTSCQPASAIAVSVKGSLKGWKVTSAYLSFLGARLHSKVTLNGAALKAGGIYTLTGTVLFTKGKLRLTRDASVKFRSCINP